MTELRLWFNEECVGTKSVSSIKKIIQATEGWLERPHQTDVMLTGRVRNTKAKRPYFKLWHSGKGWRLSKDRVAELKDVAQKSLDGAADFFLGIQNASSVMSTLPPCGNCGAVAGQPHRQGCNIERCSTCGGQQITCECETYVPVAMVWSGQGREEGQVNG